MEFLKPSEEASILSAVYSAALDDGLWQKFCDVLSEKAQAPIMMMGHNFGADDSLGAMGGGYDPYFLKTYDEHYIHINPWMGMIGAMPTGMVGMSDQACERERLFKTEFYNDWLRPQGNVIGGPATICHRDEEKVFALTMSCRADKYDQTMVRGYDLFQRIGPHVSRAIELSSLLVVEKSNLNVYLGSGTHAVIFIHRSGKIGNINAAGENLLRRGKLLSRGGNGELVSENDTVQAFLLRAASAIHRGHFAGMPGPVACNDKQFGTCMFHAHIFPEDTPFQFPASVWSDPVAGAIVVTGRYGLKPSYQHQLAAFGATRAEIRLGTAVLEGETLSEFADRNQVSRHTVRNQMRALLLKTGSRNQSGFILKMLRLKSPFSA